MRVGSRPLEEPEDATGGASRRAHRRHTGRVRLRREPEVEADGWLKDQATAQAKPGSLASQKMQTEAQAKGRIGGTPEESGCGASRELKQTVG